MMIGKQRARLMYALSGFRVVAPGDYVICAVSGKQVALEELRYWNSERQEPYADAVCATARAQELAQT